MQENLDNSQRKRVEQTSVEELVSLLNVVKGLIRVNKLQQDQELLGKMETRSLQKKAIELEKIKQALFYLRSRQLATNSKDDLATFANNEYENFPEDSDNVMDQLDISDAVDFIIKERQNSSAEWTKKQLSLLEPKKEKADNRPETEKQKNLIEFINKIGSGMVDTSLPKKYSPKGNAGYQQITDSNWGVEQLPTINERSDFMKENDYKECCTLKPIPVNDSAEYERTVTPTKISKIFKPFIKEKKEAVSVKFGVRAKSFSECVEGSENTEPAYKLHYLVLGGRDYQDYSGRDGQYFMMEIILPKSIAVKVNEQLENDPNFIRKLAEIRLDKHLSDNNIEIDFQKTWEYGDEETNNIPLKPPYSKWDQENKKIYYKFR